MREPSVLVREVAAEHLEERQVDWAYMVCIAIEQATAGKEQKLEVVIAVRPNIPQSNKLKERRRVAMALAPTSLRCFLTGRPLCTVTVPQLTKSRPSRLSCKASNEKDTLPSRGNLAVKLGKLAMVALAAGVLSLGSVDDAMAAKSGGRVGGKAFRPAPPPRSSGPRINNSRTNIYINPPVAPPLVGGYGYGYGYGGWGWSPFTFFAPGPSVAVGVGGGFDTLVLFLVLGAVVGAIRRFLNRDNEDYDD